MADSLKKSEGTMRKEEFFEWAQKQDQPYELIDGRPRPKWLSDDGITMMAGESPQHIDIQANLLRVLGNKLLEKGLACRAGVYGVDVTAAAGPNNQGEDRIVYPDTTIDCGFKNRIKTTKTAMSPIVVFEILSRSNRGHDLGDKFRWYQATEGVENIVYIEQDLIDVRLHTRTPDGAWITHIPLTKLTDVLNLPALDMSLTLAEIYEAVFVFR